VASHAHAHTDEEDAVTRSTVLVVDDDHFIREIVCDALEAEGYRTVAASDGAEALTIVEHSAAPPAAILLDLMMPGMDGWTFLAELRRTAAFAHVPVIVVSAGGRSLLARAPDDVLVAEKPVDLDRLLALLEVAIEGSRDLTRFDGGAFDDTFVGLGP
jgi:CheY-like chemotaxis protein